MADAINPQYVYRHIPTGRMVVAQRIPTTGSKYVDGKGSVQAWEGEYLITHTAYERALDAANVKTTEHVDRFIVPGEVFTAFYEHAPWLVEHAEG